MALSRRTGQRFQASIWPGFVDAMTGLLLVLMFVLTIFMVVQFVLRETITGQESKLDALSAEVAALAQALGLQERKNDDLENRVGALNATLSQAQTQAEAQEELIAALRQQRDAQDAELAQAQTRLTAFEAQVAALLAERDTALGQADALAAEKTTLLSEKEALELALAQARSEVDEGAEAARLAAAQREALETLIADLRQDAARSDEQNANLLSQLEQTREALSAEEVARLTEAAAAEALRKRLQEADTELTAMTLALEAQRKQAEDTLTLLAAAEAASEDLNIRLAAALLLQEDASGALAAAQSERGALAEQIAQLERQLAESQAALEHAQGSAVDRQTEWAATRDALEARLAEALRAKLALQEKAGQVDAQLADLSQGQDDLQAALAQALAAKLAAEQNATQLLSEAEQRAALLATAQEELSAQQAASAETARREALLNQQVAALRTQLGSLQALLDDAKERDAAAQIQLQTLGSDLNTALARAAAEERRRRQLEEAERKRLEAEALDLKKYRSEFFGRVREILGTQEGVRIVGDRFVFSSEILFPPGRADLSVDGQREIAKIAGILRSVAGDIPPEIDWVIRVDGHTDNVPLSGTGEFGDNWELSQARALSVVRYMVDFLGIPPGRLSANGFGQYQPLNPDDSAEARAQNRRIELKFTEK